jgi:hypothetical protein
MFARLTSKNCLLDAVTGFGVAAFGARLAGVTGVHAHYNSTGTFSLVREQ